MPPRFLISEMTKKILKIGTLFSGIGAFEHALNQLGIKHKILFACDCGERELPLKYGDLAKLTKGLSEEEAFAYCTNYINCVGVKVEYREKEISLLNEIVHNIDSYSEDNNIVLTYSKVGRKSPVEHKLILTQDQIINLTPNMTMRQREAYVNERYNQMPEHNFVKDAYFANYDIK